MPTETGSKFHQFALMALIAALAAANANTALATCPGNTPTRFTDNGDGTICDSHTGRMWEKKTGTVGATVDCADAMVCPDPHNVNSRNTWAATGTTPDGMLYTVFLAQLNGLTGSPKVGGTSAPCFAGHCDWRIPASIELEEILVPSCSSPPCIDAAFGPTHASIYWSSSIGLGGPADAWGASFKSGVVAGNVNWASSFFARAAEALPVLEKQMSRSFIIGLALFVSGLLAMYLIGVVAGAALLLLALHYDQQSNKAHMLLVLTAYSRAMVRTLAVGTDSAQ